MKKLKRNVRNAVGLGIYPILATLNMNATESESVLIVFMVTVYTVFYMEIFIRKDDEK